MRIHFVATDAGVDEDDYSMVCGVDGCDADGTEHTLSFDRLTESASAADPTDDWGIHVQFDDQSNGGYNIVGRCRLSRKSLSIDLLDSSEDSSLWTASMSTLRLAKKTM